MGSCKETISLTLTGRSANWGQTLRLVEKPHGCVIDRLTDEDLRRARHAEMLRHRGLRGAIHVVQLRGRPAACHYVVKLVDRRG